MNMKPITMENWEQMASDLRWVNEAPVWFKAVLSNVMGRKTHEAAFWMSILAQLMKQRHIEALGKNGLTIEAFDEQNAQLLLALDNAPSIQPDSVLKLWKAPAEEVRISQLRRTIGDEMQSRGLHRLRDKDRPVE